MYLCRVLIQFLIDTTSVGEERRLTISIQIGGSLAKVIYFTRSANPPSSPSQIATHGSTPNKVFTPLSASPPRDSPLASPQLSKLNVHDKGALTPAVLEQCNGNSHHADVLPAEPSASEGIALSPKSLNASHLHDSLLRRASVQHFPGGSLNFERFETEHIEDCVAFIRALIERSAAVNGVPLADMRRGVKVIATGGGAHRFFDILADELRVEVHREDEMACLIEGLKFITLIPDEVYYFSDELIHSVSHPQAPLSLPQEQPVALEQIGRAHV